MLQLNRRKNGKRTRTELEQTFKFSTKAKDLRTFTENEERLTK